jgi:hypothetical protein
MKGPAKSFYKNKEPHGVVSHDRTYRARICLTISFVLPILIYVIAEHFAWSRLVSGDIPILPTLYIILVASLIGVALGIFKRRRIVVVFNIIFLLIYFIPLGNKSMFEIVAVPLELYTGIDASNAPFIVLNLAFICMSSVFLSICILLALLIEKSSSIFGRGRFVVISFFVACMSVLMVVNITLSLSEIRNYLIISHLIFLILIIASFLNAHINSVIKIFPIDARM